MDELIAKHPGVKFYKVGSALRRNVKHNRLHCFTSAVMRESAAGSRAALKRCGAFHLQVDTDDKNLVEMVKGALYADGTP